VFHLRGSTNQRRSVLAVVATTLIFPTMVFAQRLDHQASTPIVIGPIAATMPPGTDLLHNYPQLASEPNFNVSRTGYIEEEFFVQGMATEYSTPPLANGVVLSTGHPYKTRLIVRRPSNPEKFNGIVIVEWVNVTSGYNLDLHWEASRDFLTREGYAYVGVSAQRVGVQQPPYGLTAWSPNRYAGLDVTDGGKITNDSLGYDIFSQAGQAIRNPSGARVDMLGGLRPRLLIAVGASQSASRLTPYYNSIHPLHGVYDGFLLHVGGGPFRTDLSTKLLRINTEREIVSGQAAIRQPDSDVFRSWEIAGASHVDYWFMSYRGQLVSRDGLAPFNFSCDRPPLSHVNNAYVLNAGYEQLVNWVTRQRDREGGGKSQGKSPPIAVPIQVTSVSPLVIPRDANGLVFGGIRLSEVDVPTATNTGANGQSSFCILYGSHEPFSPGKVAALYPNHETYVQKVRQVTRENLNNGFILDEDAEQINKAAQTSQVGTSHPLPIP
jgi:hypothetical protein